MVKIDDERVRRMYLEGRSPKDTAEETGLHIVLVEEMYEVLDKNKTTFEPTEIVTASLNLSNGVALTHRDLENKKIATASVLLDRIQKAQDDDEACTLRQLASAYKDIVSSIALTSSHIIEAQINQDAGNDIDVFLTQTKD